MVWAIIVSSSVSRWLSWIVIQRQRCSMFHPKSYSILIMQLSKLTLWFIEFEHHTYNSVCLLIFLHIVRMLFNDITLKKSVFIETVRKNKYNGATSYWGKLKKKVCKREGKTDFGFTRSTLIHQTNDDSSIGHRIFNHGTISYIFNLSLSCQTDHFLRISVVLSQPVTISLRSSFERKEYKSCANCSRTFILHWMQ